MRISLILFSDAETSTRGMVRGLIAFTVLLILHVLWFIGTKKVVYNSKLKPDNRWWILLIACLLLSCALSVQDTTDIEPALAYGSLVGLVVWGVFNSLAFALYGLSWKQFFLTTLWGVIATALTSMVLLNCPFQSDEVSSATNQ